VLVGSVQLRPINMSVYFVVTLLDRPRNFAGYVINTAGLEDLGKLLVGFKQKILKIAFVRVL